MKQILADESVDFQTVKALRNAAYKIEAVIETSPGIKDKRSLDSCQ